MNQNTRNGQSVQNAQKESADRFAGESKFINTTPFKFPRNYLSISQINSYVICPRAYYWSYVENKVEKKSSSMAVGSTGHRLFQLISEKKSMDFNFRELQDRFEMLFKNTLEEAPAEEKTPEKILELSEEKDKLVPSIIMYCKEVLPKLTYVGQELQIHHDIPIIRKAYSYRGTQGTEVIGKITIAGFMDFIASKNPKIIPPMDGGVFKKIEDPRILPFLEVGDYKIGAEKDQLYFRDDLQMIFYSMATGISQVRIDNILAARLKYNKPKVVKGVEQPPEPRKDNVPPSVNILRYQVVPEDTERLVQQISEAAIGIGSGCFPMCHFRHWKCSPKMCGHWAYCRGKDPEDKYLTKVAVEKYQY